MIISRSGFTASSLAITHNAIKSILFQCAQLLIAFTVWKLFSLLAAKTRKFTSYLMFSEDLIQKGRFMHSQKYSGGGILVLGFTIVYSLAQLYGTLLWALDSPGYIMQSKNVSGIALRNSLLENPSYIVSLNLKSGNLSTQEESLSQTIGSNLYKAGINFTLTGDVGKRTPQVAAPTRPEAGARIWLDDEGFSVSADNYVMISYAPGETGKMVALDCPVQILSETVFGWNCTFNNSFSQTLLNDPVGRPEVHWDDASDLALDSRYIRPSRQNNIWASYGTGGSTAVMKQMFTVTKGTRRHSFIENAAKYSTLTLAKVPFSRVEVLDFVKRTWSSNPEEQQAPLIDRLVESIFEAQELKRSFMYGASSTTNFSCAQVHWQYLTNGFDGDDLYSLLRISITNITLVHSETLEKPPEPYESCDASFQNEAEGGRIVDTDCSASFATENNAPHFFGQVDASAVLIITGLGDGRSNISSNALDQSRLLWLEKNDARMNDLLMSRGFIVSVDPALVTVKVGSLTPAISYLQLLLMLVAVLMAPIGWFCVQRFTSSHWSSSLLSNLLYTVDTPENWNKEEPGYIRRTPDIHLSKASAQNSSRVVIAVDSAFLTLQDNHTGNETSIVTGDVTYVQKAAIVRAEERMPLYNS
ncbi:hypothetical protein BCR34DRAFT_590667 [Clohesyomyces aquaticus]|uniref:Uncharacterized protein n=1 Tax=Clohesyomyces aquaticus TaxID=1231657 RepID=A0A1Y1Z7K8_9PLEO|nr:hypothetical protein BCR34DRAFT_590667 [Clohesyomyces aquaticus]